MNNTEYYEKMISDIARCEVKAPPAKGQSLNDKYKQINAFMNKNKVSSSEARKLKEFIDSAEPLSPSLMNSTWNANKAAQEGKALKKKLGLGADDHLDDNINAFAKQYGLNKNEAIAFLKVDEGVQMFNNWKNPIQAGLSLAGEETIEKSNSTKVEYEYHISPSGAIYRAETKEGSWLDQVLDLLNPFREYEILDPNEVGDIAISGDVMPIGTNKKEYEIAYEQGGLLKAITYPFETFSGMVVSYLGLNKIFNWIFKPSPTKITHTKHSVEQMSNRGIPRSSVDLTVKYPEKVTTNPDGTYNYIRSFTKDGKVYDLRVIGVKNSDNVVRVITQHEAAYGRYR